jgi:DNA-binding HxlR family transcriptional regulator
LEDKEKEKQLEEQITKVLTTSQTAAVKTMLEKDHAIDCLFLLALGKGKWKKAKTYMNKHDLTLSDGTYRSRMIEITQLGLAKEIPIDPLKNRYAITEKGRTLAMALLKLLQAL